MTAQIDYVNLQTTCSRDIYNSIADNVASIIGPNPLGYGYQGTVATDVTTSTALIDLIDWVKLYNEVEIINYHITGVPLSSVADAPPNTGINSLDPYKTNAILRADWVNTIITATNYAILHQYSVADNQLDVIKLTDSSNSSWDSTIVSTSDIQWADADSATYFFNLGGKIQSILSHESTQPSGYWDNQWRGLIDQANTLLALHPYNREIFVADSDTYTVSTSALNNGDYISITYRRVSGQEVQTTISFNVSTIGDTADSAIAKNLLITNSVNIYYANRILIAPKPTVSSIMVSFGQGGQPITPTIKALKVSVSELDFTMHQNDESARQTVTLTNTGNADVDLLAVIFSAQQTAKGPIPNIYIGWTPDPAKIQLTTLSAGQSTSFDVTYVSKKIGRFNNFIHVLSTSDHGTVAIKTKQNVLGPVFRTQLNTANSIDVTRYHTITDQLNISNISSVPLRSYSKGTCTLQWGNRVIDDTGAIFSVDDSKLGGPIVTFDPAAFVRFAGTNMAVATATIVVNCVSEQVPGSDVQYSSNTAIVTLNINLPESQNLGSWLSPLSEDNCVVGMSYDIINLEEYLTIGVGATPDLLNANGKITYPLPSQLSTDSLTPNNLGITADSAWSKGIPLYKVTKPTWSQNDPVTGFLYSYGVWFNADGHSPSSKLVNRRYIFNAPGDGNYNWQFAADLIAYFSIDGKILGDSRKSSSVDEARTGYTGQIFLTKGPHVIQLAGANVFNPPTTLAAFALNITQAGGQSVWSTLTPVRSGDVYPGWSEVYRIPLSSIGTGNKQTYYSGGYLVKATNPVFGQYNWQDFFGDYRHGSAGGGSLFVIDDDGHGNLKIRSQYKTISSGLTSQDQTLEQLQYITYYYDSLDFDSPQGQNFSNHSRRVHNLEDPVGGTCHQFVGFNSEGAVQTIITTYPGYNGFDPIPRYYVGSLNLGTTGVPDPGVTNWLEDLLSNPLLWILGIGYGLWTGGIGNFLIDAGTYLGGSVGGAVEQFGGWLVDTFSSEGEAGALVNQIFGVGGESVGSMVGSAAATGEGAAVGAEGLAAAEGAGTSFLGVVGEALPYIAAAYLVYTYRQQILNVVTNVVDGVVHVVGNVISSVGNFASNLIQGAGNFVSDVGSRIANALGISDERLKEEISKIVNPMEVIDQLNGYKFTYKLTKLQSNGVMAQEVEKVLPEAVSETENGYKMVQYHQFTGYLIEAVKELNKTVKTLEERIKTLENPSNRLI